MTAARETEKPELTKEALNIETNPLSADKELTRKQLYEKLLESESRAASLEAENNELQQRVRMLEKVVYGQKSEKTEIVFENAEQIHLFDEAETEATEKAGSGHSQEKTVEVPAHTRKKKATHADSFQNLQTEEVIHAAEDRSCPTCGTEMTVIGKEFSYDEIVYVPAHMFRRMHYVEVLKCPACAKDESLDETLPDVPSPVFKKAGAPSPFIPRSFCSPELLAHIVYEKYVQAVPLYRQEKEYAALGLDLSRATMANWIIYAAEKYARPVYAVMKTELLKSPVIHADETVVQVLHEDGRKPKTKSRMWVYAAPKSVGHVNCLFEYSKTRNGDNAVQFLGDYSGYLVCDGYDGYNKLSADKVIRCGCWAHLRRKFIDALPSDKTLLASSMAAEGVERCNKIFMLEREYYGLDKDGKQVRDPLPPEERHIQRQERSKPVLEAFFAWLDTFTPASSTALAKACQYARNEKKYLFRFLECPDIAPSNNRAENAIRPFVVGRKNWLFSNSERGADASALFYSLAASACANGLNVEEYLTQLFTKKSPLLPWPADTVISDCIANC